MTHTTWTDARSPAGGDAQAPRGADVETPRRLIAQARAVLLDIDGVIVHGRDAVPGAATAFRRLGERIRLVSNNSTDTPETMARRLADLGLEVAPERIFLAGATAVDILADAPPQRGVLLLAGGMIQDRAGRRGLPVVRSWREADTVVLARDVTVDYARLDAALKALHAGAELICCNPDTTHPGEGRHPVMETGSLMAALMASKPGCAVRVIGKPMADLFRAALTHAGAAEEDAVMIGDTLETDIAGAEVLGIPGILVGGHPHAVAAGLGDLVD